MVDTVAGVAAMAGGDLELAARHFAEARRYVEEVGRTPEFCDLARYEAEMLRRRGGDGDADRARQLLREAIEAGRAYGLPWHVDRAEALLQSLS